MILLDTDIMIDVLRRYRPAVVWLSSLGEEEVLLPGFVVMELIQGCRNRTEQAHVEQALEPYSVAWPSSDVSHRALSVFARYHLSHGLGIIDALVGQMSVALDLPLYTFNQKHYAAIPDLRTVQPYDKTAQG